MDISNIYRKDTHTTTVTLSNIVQVGTLVMTELSDTNVLTDRLDGSKVTRSLYADLLMASIKDKIGDM